LLHLLLLGCLHLHLLLLLDQHLLLLGVHHLLLLLLLLDLLQLSFCEWPGILFDVRVRIGHEWVEVRFHLLHLRLIHILLLLLTNWDLALVVGVGLVGHVGVLALTSYLVTLDT
jgi:hypothetical protein